MRPRTAEETRVINARSIASEIGGVAEFARRVGRSQSQMQNTIGKTPIKEFGPDLARDVERIFEKDAGWLDMPWDLISGASSQAARPDPETLRDAIAVAAASTSGVTTDMVLMAYEMITKQRQPTPLTGRAPPDQKGPSHGALARGNQGTVEDSGRKSRSRKK